MKGDKKIIDILNALLAGELTAHLINVASRDNVTHVWVAGKCCVDNKTLPNDRQNDLESAVALWQNSLEFRQRP